MSYAAGLICGMGPGPGVITKCDDRMNLTLKTGHIARLVSGHCIVAEIDPKEARPLYVDFSVYEIQKWGEGDTPGAYDMPWLEDDKYLRCNVKWDGCSNWRFGDEQPSWLHFCEREHLAKLADLMAACWDWAGEIMGEAFIGHSK